MKNLTIITLALSLSAQAQDLKQITKVLESNPGPIVECGLETKTPNIKKGEVKIAYECADFPVPQKKVDQELISFYESEDPNLIIRSRVNKKDPSEKDVTVKFRPDAGKKIELEKLLYESLKDKSDAAKEEARANGGKEALELKCESDVSLGPKYVDSCSLTTTTSDLTRDHQAFAQMSAGHEVKKRLSDYKSIKIDAQSWKVPVASFAKAVSIERWDVKNSRGESLCILEVSAKFEVAEDPKSNLPVRLKKGAVEALLKLQAAFGNKRPAKEQGNKTGRAMEFVRK